MTLLNAAVKEPVIDFSTDMLLNCFLFKYILQS